MIYINAFIICGLICALSQLVTEFTKLTPGDVNAGLVVLGAFTSSIGLYDKLVKIAGAGATVPITNFGHLLFKGAYEGYLASKITGLLNNVFALCSGGLAFTIIMGFIIGLLFKPRH